MVAARLSMFLILMAATGCSAARHQTSGKPDSLGPGGAGNAQRKEPQGGPKKSLVELSAVNDLMSNEEQRKAVDEAVNDLDAISAQQDAERDQDAEREAMILERERTVYGGGREEAVDDLQAISAQQDAEAAAKDQAPICLRVSQTSLLLYSRLRAICDYECDLTDDVPKYCSKCGKCIDDTEAPICNTFLEQICEEQVECDVTEYIPLAKYCSKCGKCIDDTEADKPTTTAAPTTTTADAAEEEAMAAAKSNAAAKEANAAAKANAELAEIDLHIQRLQNEAAVDLGVSENRKQEIDVEIFKLRQLKIYFEDRLEGEISKLRQLNQIKQFDVTYATRNTEERDLPSAP